MEICLSPGHRGEEGEAEGLDVEISGEVRVGVGRQLQWHAGGAARSVGGHVARHRATQGEAEAARALHVSLLPVIQLAQRREAQPGHVEQAGVGAQPVSAVSPEEADGVAEPPPPAEQIVRVRHQPHVAIEVQLRGHQRAVGELQRAGRHHALHVEGHLHLPHAEVQIPQRSPGDEEVPEHAGLVRLHVERGEAQLQREAELPGELPLELESRAADEAGLLRVDVAGLAGDDEERLGLDPAAHLQLHLRPQLHRHPFAEARVHLDGRAAIGRRQGCQEEDTGQVHGARCRARSPRLRHASATTR